MFLQNKAATVRKCSGMLFEIIKAKGGWSFAQFESSLRQVTVKQVKGFKTKSKIGCNESYNFTIWKLFSFLITSSDFMNLHKHGNTTWS